MAETKNMSHPIIPRVDDVLGAMDGWREELSLGDSVEKVVMDKTELAPLKPGEDNGDTINMALAMIYVDHHREFTLEQSNIFSPRMIGVRAADELREKYGGKEIKVEETEAGGVYGEEFHDIVLRHGVCVARILKEHPMIAFSLHETVLKEQAYLISGLIDEIMKSPEDAISFFSKMDPKRLAKMFRVFYDQIGIEFALEVVSKKQLGFDFIKEIPIFFDDIVHRADDIGLLGILPLLDKVQLEKLFDIEPYRVMRACKYSPDLIRKFVTADMLIRFRQTNYLPDINTALREAGNTRDDIQAILGMYVK